MYVKVNGVRLFFDVEGLQYVPEGPALKERPVAFVLHGGPGSDHATFLPAMSQLTDTMQLIYVDDRNTGRSERIGGPVETLLEQNVEDLEALRKYLGLGKIFLIGHSYGGMKAARYLTMYPDSLQGVILVDTAISPKGLDFARVLENVKKWGTPEQYDLFYSQLTGKVDKDFDFTDYTVKMASLYSYKTKKEGTIDATEVVNHNMRGIRNGALASAQLGYLRKNMDMREELRKVTLPVMVFQGEFDFITDTLAGEEIRDTIPTAEYHLLTEAAHNVFNDRPDVVFPLIREFVARNFQPLDWQTLLEQTKG